MSSFVNLNGSIEPSDKPLIAVQSRGLRFGDGLFETMKCVDGQIALLQYHYDRLFGGMQSLQFEIPLWLTRSFLSEQITQLLVKNHHQARSRVRLMIFRGPGGLYETGNVEINFLIESYALDQPVAHAGKLVIDIFPQSRKTYDAFSSIKSNNFLPYVMGALFARQNGWDDAVILNSSERVCDATIANIFIIKNNQILTPALTEACIAGVMRRYLLEKLSASHYSIEEATITVLQLYAADEIFLTNAISGIRPVTRCSNIELDTRMGRGISDQFLHDF